MSELVNYEKEYERISKEKEEVEFELKRAKGKLANESFVKKAPEKLVNAEKEKIEKYEKMLVSIEERLSAVKERL